MIYGSTAIQHWFKDYKKEPNDVDIISKSKVIDQYDKRVEVYWEPELQVLFNRNRDIKYLDPDLLYTLKLSHLSYDIKWDKHMTDAVFLKNKGAAIDRSVYTILTELWQRIHGKKQVRMKVSNKDFFKASIIRKYDHDFLHEQFAFYERPLNESIREDLSKPFCKEFLWNRLSYEDKLKCALEELLVLTCERTIYVDNPMPFTFGKTRTLKQMITSTTTGWFNLFLKENFLEILRHPIPDKIKNRIEKFK